MGKDALAVTTHTLSLRGGNEVTDAAIHRVSRGCVRVCLFAYLITWIATGCRPSWSKPVPLRLPLRNVRHPSVPSSLATAFGNQHGSRRCCYGSWGCVCALAERRAAPPWSRNHPVGPDASPMPVR